MENTDGIDWTRVAELRDEVGEDDFSEIIAIFLEEVEGVIAELPQTPSAEIGTKLHFLKGSALNLGFGSLAAQCQSGEALVANNKGHNVDLAAVIASFQATKTAFLAKITP